MIPPLPTPNTSPYIAAHLTVDPNELQLMYRRSGNPNLLVKFEVNGETHVCLLKDAQKHPVSRELLHLDFYEVSPDEEVAVEVLVRAEGKAAGEVFGGRVALLRQTLRIAAKPADIPEKFVVSVDGLQVGEFIRAGDVSLPSGVSLAIDAGTNLMTCMGKKSAAREEEAGEAGEGAEGGETAAEEAAE